MNAIDTGCAVPTGVALHPVTPEEIDEAFVEVFADPAGKNRMMSGTGRSYSKEDLVAFCRAGLEHSNCFYYRAVGPEGGPPLGVVRIGPIDWHNSVSDMSVVVGNPARRGQGLGTLLVRLGNAMAFQRHNIRKLHSGILAPNVASVRAYTHAGWFVEATLQGQHLLDGKPIDRVVVSCFNPVWQPPASSQP